MAVPMAFKIQLTDCVMVVKQVKIAITFLEGSAAMVEYSCKRIENCSALFSGNMAPVHDTSAVGLDFSRVYNVWLRFEIQNHSGLADYVSVSYENEAWLTEVQP